MLNPQHHTMESEMKKENIRRMEAKGFHDYHDGKSPMVVCLDSSFWAKACPEAQAYVRGWQAAQSGK
jgi:hypothetical protein